MDICLVDVKSASIRLCWMEKYSNNKGFLDHCDKLAYPDKFRPPASRTQPRNQYRWLKRRPACVITVKPLV